MVNGDRTGPNHAVYLRLILLSRIEMQTLEKLGDIVRKGVVSEKGNTRLAHARLLTPRLGFVIVVFSFRSAARMATPGTTTALDTSSVRHTVADA